MRKKRTKGRQGRSDSIKKPKAHKLNLLFFKAAPFKGNLNKISFFDNPRRYKAVCLTHHRRLNSGWVPWEDMQVTQSDHLRFSSSCIVDYEIRS